MDGILLCQELWLSSFSQQGLLALRSIFLPSLNSESLDQRNRFKDEYVSLRDLGLRTWTVLGIR